MLTYGEYLEQNEERDDFYSRKYYVVREEGKADKPAPLADLMKYLRDVPGQPVKSDSTVPGEEIIDGKHQILIDSGSPSTIIGKNNYLKVLASYSDEVKRGMKFKESDKTFIFGGGERTFSKGASQLPIKIVNNKGQILVIEIWVDVVDQDNVPLLLGARTLEDMEATIDCKNKSVTLSVGKKRETARLRKSNFGHFMLSFTTNDILKIPENCDDVAGKAIVNFIIEEEDPNQLKFDVLPVNVFFTESKPLRRKEIQKLHHFFGHPSYQRLKALVVKSGRYDCETEKELKEVCAVENRLSLTVMNQGQHQVVNSDDVLLSKPITNGTKLEELLSLPQKYQPTDFPTSTQTADIPSREKTDDTTAQTQTETEPVQEENIQPANSTNSALDVVHPVICNVCQQQFSSKSTDFPTANKVTVRLLLSLAATFNLDLFTKNIIRAFPQTDLNHAKSLKIDDALNVGEKSLMDRTHNKMKERSSYGSVETLPAIFLGAKLDKVDGENVVTDHNKYVKEITSPEVRELFRLVKADVLPDELQEIQALVKLNTMLFFIRSVLKSLPGQEEMNIPCLTLIDIQNLYSCVHQMKLTSDDLRLFADILDIRDAIAEQKLITEVRYYPGELMISEGLTKQTKN